jgi:RNA polymerase sigma-70 factor (ECF subfamily)
MQFSASRMTDNTKSRRHEDEHVRAARLLTRIAQNRDRQAFAEIFDCYAPRVKSFMLRKGASPEQAEDLVQETMIAVWSKAGLYEATRGSVTTWIFTIARNLRIDRIRREQTVHLTELGDYDEPSDDPGSDEVLIAAEEQGLVNRALREIPEEQKQILILSYVEDVPQTEIAERLNLPLGTVKSRMRLAYRRMRKLLENES